MACAIAASASVPRPSDQDSDRPPPSSRSSSGLAAALSMSLLLEPDQLPDALLRHLERLEDLRLGDFERAALDHDDRVGRAAHHQVDGGELELLEGGVEDPVALRPGPPAPPPADRSTGPATGSARPRPPPRRGCRHRSPGRRRATVTKTWTSFLKPSGKSGRIERSMSRLARISLSDGTALTLEESARDLARGVGLLAVLDREREEREGGDVGGDGDGGQHHRVAEPYQGGAGGLLRQSPGLDHQGASGELGFDPLYSHCLLSLGVLRFLCAMDAANAERASRYARSRRPPDASVPSGGARAARSALGTSGDRSA